MRGRSADTKTEPSIGPAARATVPSVSSVGSRPKDVHSDQVSPRKISSQFRQLRRPRVTSWSAAVRQGYDSGLPLFVKARRPAELAFAVVVVLSRNQVVRRSPEDLFVQAQALRTEVVRVNQERFAS